MWLPSYLQILFLTAKSGTAIESYRTGPIFTSRNLFTLTVLQEQVRNLINRA